MNVSQKIREVFQKELFKANCSTLLEGSEIQCSVIDDNFCFRLRLGSVSEENIPYIKQKMQAKVHVEGICPKIILTGQDLYLEYSEEIDEIHYYRFESLIDRLNIAAKQYREIFNWQEEVLFVHSF